MRLLLVRHGQPDEGNVGRPHDPPLLAEGRRQARAVAGLLAGDGVTRIVSSPQLRAQETAEPLAAMLGLCIETVDGWAEADRHLGRYRSIDTLRALGDGEWQRFLAGPVRYLGADPQRFHAAVLDALRAALDGGEEDCVAVFTHGLPINVVLSHILHLDRLMNFRPSYGSVTRLQGRHADRVGIVSVNEVGHHKWPLDDRAQIEGTR